MTAPYIASAVRQQRISRTNTPDFFPTPPWATRALVKHVIGPSWYANAVVWEPACGAGDMARALASGAHSVFASDLNDYGFGETNIDFLDTGPAAMLRLLGNLPVDWIITNPPFNLAADFAWHALALQPRRGVALLVRTAWLEGIKRHKSLFSYPRRAPSIVAQFVERVPMVKGRLDANATTATAYCWVVWRADKTEKSTELRWIPPCRKALTKLGDYPSASVPLLEAAV